MAWCLLLLLLANNALTVPTLSTSRSVASPNLISLNGNPNNNISAEQTLINPPFPQANDVIDYRVPNTPTTLLFKLTDRPISAEDMARTVLRTQIKLRRYIASHYQAAQDVLFHSDDPYTSDLDLTGCFFAVIHWPQDRANHLTYGMVDNVLKGVWEFLYRGARFVEVAFEVQDERWGVVGSGLVASEPPTPVGGNITQG